MLVLTRKSDEELLIHGNIRVRVLSIEQGRVRLGISAPRSVPVARAELLSREQLPATSPRSKPVATVSEPQQERNHDFATIG